jgi:hypothetical protein
MTTYSTEMNVFRSQVRYPITPADPVWYQKVSNRTHDLSDDHDLLKCDLLNGRYMIIDLIGGC